MNMKVENEMALPITKSVTVMLLEPYAGKLARTVLRGESSRKGADLLDNPRDYEKYWRFAQPEGNLVFRELDPKIQATMLRLLMDKKNEYIGNAIWTSAR